MKNIYFPALRKKMTRIFSNFCQKKTQKRGRKKKAIDDNQLELFNSNEQYIKKTLEKIDISSMTPLEAINLLNDLKQKSIQ